MTRRNPLEFRGNYSATSNNIKLVHWPLTGGLLHAPPSPLIAVPNVTAHPLTILMLFKVSGKLAISISALWTRQYCAKLQKSGQILKKNYFNYCLQIYRHEKYCTVPSLYS